MRNETLFMEVPKCLILRQTVLLYQEKRLQFIGVFSLVMGTRGEPAGSNLMLSSMRFNEVKIRHSLT